MPMSNRFKPASNCVTDRSKAILLWVFFFFFFFFFFYVLVLKFFVLLAPYVCCHIIS